MARTSIAPAGSHGRVTSSEIVSSPWPSWKVRMALWAVTRRRSRRASSAGRAATSAMTAISSATGWARRRPSSPSWLGATRPAVLASRTAESLAMGELAATTAPSAKAMT